MADQPAPRPTEVADPMHDPTVKTGWFPSYDIAPETWRGAGPPIAWEPSNA
jgi:hypothetical protein